jgi:poly(3-hydroxybutyrate) depolymerase
LRKDYKTDAKRIYATGHSNGGEFTYLLWHARGKEFAAFAPSGALNFALVKDHLPFAREKKAESNPASTDQVTSTDRNSRVKREYLPKPVLHVAGENDAGGQIPMAEKNDRCRSET